MHLRSEDGILGKHKLVKPKSMTDQSKWATKSSLPGRGEGGVRGRETDGVRG